MSDPNRPAEPWMIARLQRAVANDIACEEMPYDKVLGILQKWRIFEEWTVWEMDHRPVDVTELSECIEQELGLS